MRFFEILPASLAWLTIVLMLVFSRFFPEWVSIFIILFDTYWLLKTIYLSFHLRATFVAMKRNMKIDWLAKLEEARDKRPAFVETTAGRQGISKESSISHDWRDIYHLVILPMYNEPYEVVRDSFATLARVHYPKEKLMVVLALEERAGAPAEEVGKRIQKEYGHLFGKFLVTVHPAGLPGEIPGKGSNESFAAACAKELLAGDAGFDPCRVLVSVFDVDTQVFPEYFGRLAYVFLNAPHPLRSIYQPVPLFTNNIHEAPTFARVVSFSATFWQMMQQSRPERLTSFSSQAIPLQTLIEIGFWQRDMVSEDSRIFWQGYLRYHSDFRVEPLLFPVSMDAAVAPTFWGTIKSLYKQQRRWAWGSENVPYILNGFRNDPAISAKKKWYWSFNAIEGYHSWATNSLMIFALGWLPLTLGGGHFNHTLLSYSLPHVTRFIISLSMIGIASSAILSFTLLPPKPSGLGVSDYLIYFLQWALMPFTLIAFGTLPAMEAQTRLALGGKWRLGFWVTPKSRSTRQGISDKGLGL